MGKSLFQKDEHMRNGKALLLAAVIALAGVACLMLPEANRAVAVGLEESDAEMPNATVLFPVSEKPNPKGASMTPVTFNHQAHVDKIDDCTACHHTGDMVACSTCHTVEGKAEGNFINLERAMECGGRFGGHIVSGHVDACGRVESLTKEGIAVLMTVSVPDNLLKYIAEKGSVTLDGTSLTVVSAGNDSFVVSLIPHTLSSTTLGLLRVGSPVNVEVDMLARYVERLLDFGKNEPDGSYKESDSGRLTIDFLKDNGF